MTAIQKEIKKRIEQINKLSSEIRTKKLHDILSGYVRTDRIPLKMGTVQEILKEQFYLELPPDLASLFGLNQPDEPFYLVDAFDDAEKREIQDIIFLAGERKIDTVGIDEAEKTIHLHSGGTELGIAGVVTCQDGVKRVAAAEFGKTKEGWVLARFGLSINGFDKQTINEEKVGDTYDHPFPTQPNHPYTAGIVTKSMVYICNGSYDAKPSLHFFDPTRANYYSPSFDRLGSKHIKANVKDGNFSLTCYEQPIVTFPVRIPHK